jgi:hypothetical protein
MGSGSRQGQVATICPLRTQGAKPNNKPKKTVKHQIYEVEKSVSSQTTFTVEASSPEEAAAAVNDGKGTLVNRSEYSGTNTRLKPAANGLCNAQASPPPGDTSA